MNLDIFKKDDPSGSLSKESFLFKNHREEYDYIIDYCKSNFIFDLPFKEKVYLCLIGIKKVPTCKNPNCNRKVKFKNSKIGYLKYCSKKCISSDPNIKAIKEEKSLQKFGTKTPAQSSLIKEKIVSTNLEKWGANSPMCTKEIQDKSKKTLQLNWGVDNPNQSSEIKERRINSFKLNGEKWAESYKNTNMKKWGADHPWKVPEIHNLSVINSIKTKTNTLKEKIINRLEDYNQYKLLDIEFNSFKRDIIIFCNKCNDKFTISREDFYFRHREKTEICYNCNPISSSISGQQSELFRFISEKWNHDILLNSRIIYPQEIDIYLPDLKLGFEFNGLYWHSESKKGKDYHLNKTKRCRDLGIDLIHIWEDDWVYKNDIVRSIILNRIKLFESKIFARKCRIDLVESQKSINFLNQNHILGNVNSNVKLGLFYENELVSLMCFTKRGKSFELSRFCNRLNTNVVGGASKIFNYFINNFDFTEIISYSDTSMFNGNVYEKLGFKFICNTKINYKWVISKKRLHKSNFRKSRLVERGFDKNKSESDIMIEDVGAFKVWDCGLKKWVWKK